MPIWKEDSSEEKLTTLEQESGPAKFRESKNFGQGLKCQTLSHSLTSLRSSRSLGYLGLAVKLFSLFFPIPFSLSVPERLDTYHTHLYPHSTSFVPVHSACVIIGK